MSKKEIFEAIVTEADESMTRPEDNFYLLLSLRTLTSRLLGHHTTYYARMCEYLDTVTGKAFVGPLQMGGR